MRSNSEHQLGPMTLIGEASRVSVSQPVASIMTGLIVAVVCGVILSTTGQTVQAEEQVLARIDDAGTRAIVITDEQGNAEISATAVERIAGLSHVEWVLGLSSATDIRNAAIGAGGSPATLRILYGTPPEALATLGRTPSAGEALVGADAQKTLGLERPIGGVLLPDGDTVSVVGGFSASEPLAFLNRSLLVTPTNTTDAPLRSIHVQATDPEHVEPVSQAVLAVLDPLDSSSLSIQTSETLADIRAAVAGELGQFSRSLVLLVLGVGLVLVALTVYAGVTLRRQDFGRRRALGASRTAIISLVAVQNLLVAVAGACAGAAAGAFLVWRWTGSIPRPFFNLAVVVLAILASLVAALPPALVAALRDPVRVLRVP